RYSQAGTGERPHVCRDMSLANGYALLVKMAAACDCLSARVPLAERKPVLEKALGPSRVESLRLQVRTEFLNSLNHFTKPAQRLHKDYTVIDAVGYRKTQVMRLACFMSAAPYAQTIPQ
ncbi:MAG TPA: hypothetical protein VI029_20355, partial [Mycobacterium sp.]